ncbi:MAG TPA: AAA family ATPase [Geobacteraceae bacterium]|nr:AAA family ATPase [Geobacteraceae bacterium]
MHNPEKHCEIWAVGGGKGGTGKSFVISSMGTHLAHKRGRTILLDADLGAANLHTFLGMNRLRHSLSDFFERKVPLSDIVTQSGIANLELISGSFASLDSESINTAQKQKLFRHIRALEADHVLIDLGAGSHINTLDTFLLADKMIVVTSPELTAIENMYQFIKSVYFRKLKTIFKTYNLSATIQEIWKNRAAYNIRNLKDLIVYLKQSSDHIHEIIERELSGFVVHVVLNQVRTPRDFVVGENLKSVCSNFLGLTVIYAGHSRHDEAVQKSINSKEPFMLFNRFSPLAKEIRTLTEIIATGSALSLQKDPDHGNAS